MNVEIKIIDVWGRERNDRKGVVVEITNKGQVFRWMPKYDDLDKIKKLLSKVEQLNEDKALIPYNIPEEKKA
jgi:hypothetical protein